MGYFRRKILNLHTIKNFEIGWHWAQSRESTEIYTLYAHHLNGERDEITNSEGIKGCQKVLDHITEESKNNYIIDLFPVSTYIKEIR